MSTNNWPQQITMQDTLRQTEKRLQHQERRPQIRKASDILGPGMAPYAVQISDFNSDVAAFNGILYAAPNALNSPDLFKWWIGTVIATSEGSGIQEFRTFKTPDWPALTAIRNFETFAPPLRTYSAWTIT